MAEMNNSVRYLDEDETKNDLIFFCIYVFGVLLPMSIFIVTGNSFIIVTAYRSSTTLLQRRATNKFIASLAVADLLVGVSLVPIFYLGIFVENLKTDFYFCLVILLWLFVPCGTSMLHVLCIAFDQFLAVIFPLLYHQLMTSRRSTLMIICAWSLNTVLGLTPFMGWRRQVKRLDFCYFDQVLPFSYMLFFSLLMFATPLVFMTIMYSQIIRAARQNVLRINAITFPTRALKSTAKQRLSEMKATKTTAIVVGVFLLCWLPAWTFNLTMEYINLQRGPSSRIIRLPYVEAGLNMLAIANSGANPIIYAYRYSEFRTCIKNVLKRLRERACTVIRYYLLCCTIGVGLEPWL